MLRKIDLRLREAHLMASNMIVFVEQLVEVDIGFPIDPDTDDNVIHVL